MVEGKCGQTGYRTLIVAVTEEGIHVINSFFAYSYKLREIKSHINNIWVGGVKNGSCCLDHGTIKSVTSQEGINDFS